MIDAPLWYCIAFLLAVLFVVVPALAYWLEDKQEKRDKETWDRLNGHGGRR